MAIGSADGHQCCIYNLENTYFVMSLVLLIIILVRNQLYLHIQLVMTKML